MVTKDEYLLQKHIFLVLFSELENDLDGCEWLTDLNSLESMRVMLRYLTENNYLSEKIKNRVYTYISKSREIKTDDYEKRVDVLNQIVALLNGQIHDESYIFYISEFVKRRNTKMSKNLVFTIDNYTSEMEDSISFDYIVLKGHSKEVSQEEFENDYLNYYVENSLFYYESLNAIVKEMPSILDDTFKERIKIVLDRIYRENKYIGVKVSNKKIMKRLKIK